MKSCTICKAEGKYKCPTCLVYYCSAACCRTHRTQNCQVIKQNHEDPAENHEKQPYSFPTEDTIPLERLELLRNSEELRGLLQNPHLRVLLQNIDETNDPRGTIEKAMLEPLFTEFATACLKVVDNEEQDPAT